MTKHWKWILIFAGVAVVMVISGQIFSVFP
jgi:hypothetical protein